MEIFTIGSGLNPNTKLYRYINIESFISFVETKLFRLSNINSWDDKWEVILSKIPVVNDEDKVIVPLYSFYQQIYGQCWSLKKESDAMWRIYSPHKTGLQIETSVDKFKLIRGLKKCHIEKVIYFETIKELIE